MRGAVATGAGTGIGTAVAGRLTCEGSGVVPSGRRREPLEEMTADTEHASVVAADPEEVVVVAFLLHDDASYATGAAVPADGGTSVVDHSATACARA